MVPLTAERAECGGSGNNTKRKMVNQTDQNGAAVLVTEKHMEKTQTT